MGELTLKFISYIRVTSVPEVCAYVRRCCEDVLVKEVRGAKLRAYYCCVAVVRFDCRDLKMEETEVEAFGMSDTKGEVMRAG